MIRSVIFFFSFLISLFFSGVGSQVAGSENDINNNPILQQPQQDYQLLYNGRIWKNLYYNIRGDEYLFSKDFLHGSVTMNGKTFNNVDLKYDIYNDELILMVNAATYIQLNKEMVTAFTLDYSNTVYNFRKLPSNSQSALSGYVNILYEGKTSLYLKFRKEILKLAVDHKYDEFNQIQSLFLNRDGQYNKISGKGDFLNLLDDEKVNIREYIKSDKIKLNKKRPESFISILKYYDSLR